MSAALLARLAKRRCVVHCNTYAREYADALLTGAAAGMTDYAVSHDVEHAAIVGGVALVVAVKGLLQARHRAAPEGVANECR